MTKKHGIIFSTIQVTAITFLIKILGLVKQSVLAAVCGATAETDAFFVASGIIVSLCIVIFSAISISLLSIHTNTLLHEGREKSNELINAVLRTFLPVAALLSVAFYLLAPLIGKALAPAYSGRQLDTLAEYIRIMSAAFVLWCYYLILNVILETDKSFLPGKMQGLFQNVFLIAGALLLYPHFGVRVLLYALLLSGVFQCILVTWCVRSKFRLIFHRTGAKTEVHRLLRLTVPLIAGNAIYEINDIVDKQISTGLGEGSVSFLNYGATVNEIVTGVIVSSVSTVLFSHFATWMAEGETERVEKGLENCMEYLTVLIVPIMVMCLAAGDQIVELLYARGNFGAREIWMTCGVVAGYAVGFIFQMLRANIIKVFYAAQDTRTPMINGMLAVGANILLSFLLSRVTGVSGIALATSISAMLVTTLLLKDIRRYLPGFSLRGWLRECGKGIIAGVAALAAVWLLRRSLHSGLLILFAAEGIICVLLYTVLLWLLRSKCVRDAVGILSVMINSKRG